MQVSNGPVALSAVLTAGYLLVAPAANAQAQQTPPASTTAPNATLSPSAPSADIPDQKLDAAAKAVKGISALQNTYEQKIAQAPQADKNRIADEADSAMAKVVTDQGLSVEEYTNILQVAQNNPTVHQKLLDRLKQ
jgi:Domain of unknown function (DUF4168)